MPLKRKRRMSQSASKSASYQRKKARRNEHGDNTVMNQTSSRRITLPEVPTKYV